MVLLPIIAERNRLGWGQRHAVKQQTGDAVARAAEIVYLKRITRAAMAEAQCVARPLAWNAGVEAKL